MLQARKPQGPTSHSAGWRSRRDVLRQAGARAAALLLGSAGALAAGVRSAGAGTGDASATSRRSGPQEQPQRSELSFLDMHVHLNDATMQRELMDEYGLARAVVFWGGRSDNESLLREAAAQPDRYIPFASVSPERLSYRTLWDRRPDQLVSELDRLLRTGLFRGIGEISVAHFPGDGFPEADYDPTGAAMLGIVRLASRFALPITIHCEITRLREFAQLVDAFPDVTVIWAHGGYTPYFLARRMIEQHANVVYELSARTWESHPRSPDYTIFRNDLDVWPEWLELIGTFPDRFLVGTDASHRSLEAERRKIERVQLLLAQLPDAAREQVSVGNPARILGL
jgi:predicted TIM-barrel fold metal-dependent hydrolase